MAVQFESLNLAELVRRSLLASVGALVVVQDNLEGWVQTLIERGEQAEAEGRQYVDDLLTQHRGRRKTLEVSATRVRSRASLSWRARVMDWGLRRLGRPTNRETRELAERLDQLEDRIATLSQTMDSEKV